MNPMVQAMAGSVARWLMALAGAHGVALGNDQANVIVNAGLIIAPIVWSLIHKKKVDTAIKKAADTGVVGG